MTETKFTVFAKWNDGSERQGKSCYFPTFNDETARSLAERIDFVRNYFGRDSFVPCAWTAEHADLRNFEAAMAESIAAGRTIELVDGRYVPRGVPVEDKPAETLGDLLRQVLDRGVTVPPKYIGIDWAKDCAPAATPPAHQGAHPPRAGLGRLRALRSVERLLHRACRHGRLARHLLPALIRFSSWDRWSLFLAHSRYSNRFKDHDAD